MIALADLVKLTELEIKKHLASEYSGSMHEKIATKFINENL